VKETLYFDLIYNADKMVILDMLPTKTLTFKIEYGAHRTIHVKKEWQFCASNAYLLRVTGIFYAAKMLLKLYFL
jgi:hypothetical protein